MAQSQGEILGEYSQYRDQVRREFAQYNSDLIAEFNAYVEYGVQQYEKKHERILTKIKPTAEDIKRNDNNEDKALVELDILQDIVTDEFEHGEKIGFLKKQRKTCWNGILKQQSKSSK